MRVLNVSIEINGIQHLVGTLSGETFSDVVFRYDSSYLKEDSAKPISISLPLQAEPFSVEITTNFFEGLLPEGFSRKSVANWAKVHENDYLSILEKLGNECLGAIRINDDRGIVESGYRKLSLDEVKRLAAEGATKSTEFLVKTHLSLTGASGKVGLYYDEPNKDWYLPMGVAASTHIVKQSHVRLQGIVTNEQFCMLTAKHLGIAIPETFILNLGNGKDGEVLFATKRYDRQIENQADAVLARPLRLHQEDFCQALGINAAEKYETIPSQYMRKMFDLVRYWSSSPIEDQLKLWDIIVVNYLIGNTDCHLKNYSLLYSSDLQQVRLAPAYDLVCTLLYGGTTEMAFAIGGEKNITRINRDTFKRAAIEVGIGAKIALKHFDSIAQGFEHAVKETADDMKKLGYEGVDRVANYLLERAKVTLR